MHRIEGRVQHYAWGSRTELPRFLGIPPDGSPWAEIWYGAHALAPARLEDGSSLDDRLALDPQGMLGEGVARAFEGRLPYLLKVIAPERPLSLQVHPDRERAQESFAAENAAGLPLDSARRSYRDPHSKPELVVALSTFTALCGFRTPRRAIEILEGLGTRLSERLHRLLVGSPTPQGMHAALRALLSPSLRPDGALVSEVVEACRRRESAGTSPSPRIDRLVGVLAAHHPGDPGAVAALLLNPVTLQPGEALFIPTGTLHAYVHGLGIEASAASDNVLRAGLTDKRTDVDELLQCVSVTAAPPMRVAPERRGGATDFYYAPVDDFEISFTTLAVPEGDAAGYPLIGSGPRILLAVEGDVRIAAERSSCGLRAGQAVLVTAADGAVRAHGRGRVVQAGVP